MSIKLSADDAGLQLREAAEDARWGIREAAWSFEERVLWPVSDAGRAAMRRAMRALQPLQRLIQTKLVWPLSDRLDDYGAGARTAVATIGVAAALGAGAAGAILAGSEEPSAAAGAPALAADPAGTAPSLQGVAPDFVADPNAATTTAPEAAGSAGPSAPPARVAWRFAQAFVQYEVGEVDEQAVNTFQASATPPLAAALGTDPPRLPEGSKVPEAEVLNVVLGTQAGKEMTASVSLLRLQAASELRLTLLETEQGWRVAGVLG